MIVNGAFLLDVHAANALIGLIDNGKVQNFVASFDKGGFFRGMGDPLLAPDLLSSGRVAIVIPNNDVRSSAFVGLVLLNALNKLSIFLVLVNMTGVVAIDVVDMENNGSGPGNSD